MADGTDALAGANRLRQQRFAEAQKRHTEGDVLGALRIYEALAPQLRHPTLYTYWALALQQLGREREARARMHEALALLPEQGMVPVRTVLATVLRRFGEFAVAERLLHEALRADPANAAARNNLALVLMQTGRLDEADDLFAEAQQALPEDAAPSLNRMRIALQRRDFAQAEAMLAAAKNSQPGHPDVPLMEAKLALLEADQPRAAQALFKTLGKQPAHSEAWNLLMGLDAQHLPFAPAEELLRNLVRLRPTSAKLLGMAVGLARKHLICKPLPELEAQLEAALENYQDALIEVGAMFLLLSANVSQKAHRVASHNGFEFYIARGRDEPRPAPRPLDGRRLRVGYLSSDLRGHAIGYLVAGVMEAHQHSPDCEFFAYSNWADDGSDIRKRMRAAFSRFVNITELSDAELAERMRRDGVDVLVDLNQMTVGNRLGVFCHGPAPVTVQWLGMPGTVGAGRRIDYVLMDPWTLHPGNRDGFDEQPVLLAGSYQPNDWQRPDLTRGKTRADWKLPETAPVLCSFNQTQKFSPDTIALWARILQAVPEAVLWVLAGDAVLEERFTTIFTEAGIARERICFAPRADHDTHIARLRHADLMLDNWPYNAHTTCSDALRAGCPVLTLPGRTFASRVAAGILDSAGLSEWIATSPEDYVAKAVDYLRQPREALERIKAQIYSTYWASPQVDCAAFARRLEAFYLAAHARALAADDPAPAWVSWQGEVHWELPPAEAWRETVLANRPDGRSVAALSLAPEPLPARTPAPATPAQGAPAGAAVAPAIATPWQERLQRGSQHARFHNLRILRDEVLMLPEPLIVDVGAKPAEQKVWDALSDQGLMTVLGFDPQAVEESVHAHRRILPVALGDGGEHTLHVCQNWRMSSLLPPRQAYLARFPMFEKWGEVVETMPVTTQAADAVEAMAEARFLKIDTQGAELMILQHAERLLAESLGLIELELSPVPLYEGEASLFAVGVWLEERGWVLHHLANINRRVLKPLGRDEAPYQAFNHILQLDAVFMPHPDRLPGMDSTRLLSLAFLAHALYGSYDLAALALQALAEGGGPERLAAYRAYLKAAGIDA